MKTRVAILFAILLMSVNACTAGNTGPVNTAIPLPTEDGPPSATLEIDGVTQTAGIGTFCWNTKTGSGENVDMCVDKIGIPTAQNPIILKSPVTARLRFSISDPPYEMSASIFAASNDNKLDADAGDNRWWSYSEGMSLELLPEAEQEIRLEQKTGLYIFYIFAVWEGKGDASYGFLIEVK